MKKVYAGHPHGWLEVPDDFEPTPIDLDGASGCVVQNRICDAEMNTRERALAAHMYWLDSYVFAGKEAANG